MYAELLLVRRASSCQRQMLIIALMTVTSCDQTEQLTFRFENIPAIIGRLPVVLCSMYVIR